MNRKAVTSYLLLALILLLASLALIYGITKKTHAPAEPEQPTATSTQQAAPIEGANIQVATPAANQEISSPVMLIGVARVFENTFSWRVKDADGTTLGEGYAMADAPDVGQFGAFNVEAAFTIPNGATGTIEVFENSAKDGSEINKVTIPVTFVQ